MADHTLDDLNEADEETFVDALGDVYETSPWVAERVVADRPFDSVEDLHGEVSYTSPSASTNVSSSASFRSSRVWSAMSSDRRPLVT